jgi:hypothetical protein
MDGHLADLCLAFKRMRRYGLKMNPLKCVFGVSAGKFLRFTYLRQFIFNLLRKISAFALILWLKNEAEFTWRAEQQRALDDIKKYLSSPSVMKAPIVRTPFWLYIAAKDAVIGAVLMQIIEGMEHIIT